MVNVTCETEKGGAVQLGDKAWASYAVAGVAGLPAPELFYAGVSLPSGKKVNLFVNRETGLIVVDVVAKNGKSGVEICRQTA